MVLHYVTLVNVPNWNVLASTYPLFSKEDHWNPHKITFRRGWGGSNAVKILHKPKRSYIYSPLGQTFCISYRVYFISRKSRISSKLFYYFSSAIWMKRFCVESFVWIRWVETFILNFSIYRVYLHARATRYTWPIMISCTHVEISHLTASLQTSRQQVVLLVPSCQQVWNKLLTTCDNLVNIIRLVASLFQHVWYNHDITILLQPYAVNVVTFLLYHDCIGLVETTLQKSDNAIKFVTSC
jgi:hypothetical protein